MSRAFIVGGARTPFARAFAELTRIDTIGLGAIAVKGALDRSELPWDAVQAIVWGGVILPPTAPNVGREIALDLGLPKTVEAMTVTRACASSLQAISSAASMIERGDADVVIAGGSDSTSNAPLTMPQSLVHKAAPVALGGKAGPADWVKLLAALTPRDVIPKAPKVAERSTGQVMGEAAEEMARRNEISREAQDAFAVRSHQRAAAAQASGRFADEIVPIELPGGKGLYSDTIVRADTSTEKLAKLRSAFAKQGTLTAGNSSSLTDGAACVILMSEAAAKRYGMAPKAAVSQWAYVAVDPADQLLMGPALAIPKVLDRLGLSLSDMDRVDLHEAFAAQVLSVLKMMASPAFAKARLGKDAAVGEVPDDKLNVHGGSLAIGHPFGATGARMALTMANELATTDAKRAVLGICAAGGLGGAMVLERP